MKHVYPFYVIRSVKFLNQTSDAHVNYGSYEEANLQA